MTRSRSLPWLHRYSRLIIGAIAVVGLIISAYLTFVEITGAKAACPVDPTTGVSGCELVAKSPYAKVFGLPLALFGMLGYIGIIILALAPYFINPESSKKLRNQIDEKTWFFLLIGATAMVVFSAYLTIISLTVIKATCIYCLGSGICSLLLFLMTIFGRTWDEIDQVILTCILVGFVTLVGTLGIYGTANAGGQETIPLATTKPVPPIGWEITTTSGPAEISLAEHLTKVGMKKYGAFWCPHCYEQKQLFGKEAFKKITYIECDPQGKNPQPQMCQAAKIQGFPSWQYKGQIYSGTQSLEELAKISSYTGATNFKYKLP
jgi:uncharacterized membrane protein